MTDANIKTLFVFGLVLLLYSTFIISMEQSCSQTESSNSFDTGDLYNNESYVPKNSLVDMVSTISPFNNSCGNVSWILKFPFYLIFALFLWTVIPLPFK